MGDEALELVGVPAVVLVGEGDPRGVGGERAQQPFDVEVEPDVVVPPHDLEPRVVTDGGHDEPAHLVLPAVGADEAAEGAERLVADRAQLHREELRVGAVRREDDGARTVGERRHRTLPVSGRSARRVTGRGPTARRQ